MDGLLYSTSQKSSETSGSATNHPQSHPIPKFYIYKWDGTEDG